MKYIRFERAAALAVPERCPRRVNNLALPDVSVVTGTSAEVFAYYGLDARGIAEAAKEVLA